MGTGALLELRNPLATQNGHHVSTLGERDDMLLSNPSFFAEKKREGMNWAS
jgi:hypothetical protein